MRKTEIIHPALLRRFDAIYQSTRQNRGNRPMIRNIALPDAIEDLNKMLTWIVNNSEPGAPVKFFVQGDGAAKKNNPTCGKYGGMEGMPFVVPADGTLIPPERPGGESVVFRRANFLPGLSFQGVRTRCKGTHGAGNTKRKKAVKFLYHKVDFNRDIFRFSDEKVKYMNESRVALVWIEVDPKKLAKAQAKEAATKITSLLRPGEGPGQVEAIAAHILRYLPK